MRRLWIDSSLALRNLTRQRRRTALSIAAVAFGVIAYLLASGFIEWILFDMRESTIHSQLGHVQVVRPGYYEKGRSDPFRYLLPSGGPELDAIERVPGVRIVAPRLVFSGLVSHGEATLSFIGEGVSPGREADLSRSLDIVKGRALIDDDPQGVLFGAGLAANLGVDIGDRVVVIATRRDGGVNAAELTVRGIFATISKTYDDAALRLPIATAQRLLRTGGAHAWVVLLDDTRRTDAVAAMLRERLPARGFQVVPWHELADFYNKTVSLFTKQVEVVRVIIAAIIVLSITNTMMMGVMERTSEIGTSMALGTARRRILGLFVVEGGLLGVLGGGLGIVLGIGLAALISHIGIPMPPPPGMAHGFIGQIRVTPETALAALVLALGTTLAASVYPAWRASRLRIVDALRHNR